MAISGDWRSHLMARTCCTSSIRLEAPPSLFRVPLLGGAVPSKLVENIETPPTFSPDGAAMAFRRTLADGGSAIVRASADGTGQRDLAKRAGNDPFSGARLAWSPDGTMIASFAGRPPGRNGRVVLVNADTGDERPLGEARFFTVGGLCWVGAAAPSSSTPSRSRAGAGTGTASSGRLRIPLAHFVGSRPTMRVI